MTSTSVERSKQETQYGGQTTEDRPRYREQGSYWRLWRSRLRCNTDLYSFYSL